MDNRKGLTERGLLKLRGMRIVECMSIGVMTIGEERQKEGGIMAVEGP